MKRTFSPEDKETCWALWRQGLGFSDIARVLDAKPGSIFTLLRTSGGYQPYVAQRSPRHLSAMEREHIAVGIAKGQSLRSIAKMIARSPSTISREVCRNGGAQNYRACLADNAAWQRAKRPKNYRLSESDELLQLVASKLETKWSPQQICGWLKTTYPNDPEMWVSHETIYKSLYIRSRDLLDSSLMKNLRSGRRMRQSRKHSRKGDRGTINIVNGVSIHNRPLEADDRAATGHWEGDLLSGSGNSHIATLVDRKSRYTILLKLSGKDAASVNNALISGFNKLPTALKKSLTWDRGMELAKHEDFTKQTGMPVSDC